LGKDEPKRLVDASYRMALRYEFSLENNRDNYEFTRFLSELLKSHRNPQAAKELNVKYISVLNTGHFHGNLDDIFCEGCKLGWLDSDWCNKRDLKKKSNKQYNKFKGKDNQNFVYQYYSFGNNDQLKFEKLFENICNDLNFIIRMLSEEL
jgi:hypothetical protein